MLELKPKYLITFQYKHDNKPTDLIASEFWHPAAVTYGDITSDVDRVGDDYIVANVIGRLDDDKYESVHNVCLLPLKNVKIFELSENKDLNRISYDGVDYKIREITEEL